MDASCKLIISVDCYRFPDLNCWIHVVAPQARKFLGIIDRAEHLRYGGLFLRQHLTANCN